MKTPFNLPKVVLATAAVTVLLSTGTVRADSWSLQADVSELSFVSIKAEHVAESHTFDQLGGSISPSGAAELTIGIDSVNTAIDIRNERMREHLFNATSYPQAKVSTQVDLAEIAELEAGESLRATLPSKLSLRGIDSDVNAELRITRVSTDRMLVTTAKPIILNAEALGLGAGVQKLRELANLPSISLAVPVNFNLVFVVDDKVVAK